MLRHFMWVVFFNAFLSVGIFGVELSPTTFRFSLEERQTQELNIINTGNKSLRYKVFLERPKDQTNEDLYLGEWVRFYPKILSVPPKSTRVVRFRAAIPKDVKLEDGEYRALLSLEEITPKEDAAPAQLETEDEEEGGTQFDLKTLFTYQLSLYGETGELKPKLEFRNLNIKTDTKDPDKFKLTGTIVNRGNVSSKTMAYLTFKDARGKVVAKDFEVIFPIAIREGSADILLQFDKPGKNIKQVDFDIRDWSPIEIGDTTIEQKVIQI